MNETHRIKLLDEDPRIRLQLPIDLLRQLQKSAKDNGRDFNIELLMRLVRTLESDCERDQFDQNFEKIFFMESGKKKPDSPKGFDSEKE